MMGFRTITKYLNNDVAVRVAATEMKAVVAAVVMIVVVGRGTSTSVNGISTICASGGRGISTVGLEALGVGLVFVDSGAGSELIPSTPGGGCKVLGGTTKGL